MNTNLKTGTGAGGVLEGLARYIEDKGYEYSYLKFQGWRKRPERFGLGEPVPDLNWLKSGIKGNSTAWLNSGGINTTLRPTNTPESEGIGLRWSGMARMKKARQTVIF